MKTALRPAVLASMLLDLVPLGYAIYLTVVGASATDVPDAGLVVVVTVPLIGLLVMDLVLLYTLGLKERGLKFLLVYYALTRAVAVFMLYSAQRYGPSTLGVGALVAVVVLAAYTLMAINECLRRP